MFSKEITADGFLSIEDSLKIKEEYPHASFEFSYYIFKEDNSDVRIKRTDMEDIKSLK